MKVNNLVTYTLTASAAESVLALVAHIAAAKKKERDSENKKERKREGERVIERDKRLVEAFN